MAEQVDPEICAKCGFRGTPFCSHPSGFYLEEDKDGLAEFTTILQETKKREKPQESFFSMPVIFVNQFHNDNSQLN
jgi:hypothetical protein